MEVNSESGKNSRSFVRFNVSTIPAGSTIDSATLTLCAGWVPNTTRTYELHRVTGTWSETTITWNNQPTVAGTPTQTQTTPAVASCWTWTVTGDVQAWVNGTATNYGWRLKDQAEGNTPGKAMGIRTKEYTADTSKHPKLDVTYTPP